MRCPLSSRQAVLCLVFVLAVLPAGADEVVPNPLRERIQARLAQPDLRSSPALAEAVATFYTRRDYDPAWIGRAGLNEDGKLIVEILRDSWNHGLNPADYDLKAIDDRLGGGEIDALAAIEVLMTGAVLRYCFDVRSGRASPRDADPEWFVEADGIDHLAALEESLAEGNLAEVLGGLVPPDSRYARLQTALARYRAIADSGGWPRLEEGPALEPDLRHPTVVSLRQRLGATGDLDNPGSSDPYDAALEAAVVRFQARHGLDTDGVVGPKTRAALNVDVNERIQQIVLNMERWRWMPRHEYSRYIVVNMAGFELRVIEGDAEVRRMRVVIGRPYRRTPAFTEAMTYVDINPYWNVPPSLAVRDILPKVLEDPQYLQKQGIRVFSDWTENAQKLDRSAIDWAEVGGRGFPYKLRQDPGPHNALGRIKFMFPNRFNIYLHDTPHREHFPLSVRAFSSGCIRLEEPLDLAAYVLGDLGWTPEQIRQAVDSGSRRVISLPHPIPVYLVYWTAWVETDGTIHFRDDVYGRDKLLRTALTTGVPGGIRTGAV